MAPEKSSGTQSSNNGASANNGPSRMTLTEEEFVRNPKIMDVNPSARNNSKLQTSPVSPGVPPAGNDSETSIYQTSVDRPQPNVTKAHPNVARAQLNVAKAQRGGNYIESEIEIRIEDIASRNNMRGGNLSSESESSIQINTVDLTETVMMGGGIDSDFDSNKLLNTIMQLGGDMESSESSESENSEIFTPTPTEGSTSSYAPNKSKPTKSKKPKAKGKRLLPDDSPSDSSSSDSSSDSFEMDDDDSLEHDPDTPIDTETVLRKAHTNMVTSDVYIMSDSDSANARGITLMSFNDPLKYKKSKSGKKSKK